LVTSQVASAVSYARAYETERQRAEALAEIDRAKTALARTSARSADFIAGGDNHLSLVVPGGDPRCSLC